MDILANKYKSSYKILNFDHLMRIYEKNYSLFSIALEFINDQNKASTILINDLRMYYEPISLSKYTHIFRLYYKFRDLSNNPFQSYSLKPHLIYTLYRDAKLLEAKTLEEFRNFDSSVDNKINLNLSVYYWLKALIEKSDIYQ